MLGRGERSKCCYSELNSFLFLFGFQMANLHRCAGQTAGMCQDWEQTQHMLLHLISNVGTWKRGRCLWLGIKDAKERGNPSILHDYPYQSCPGRTDSSDYLASHFGGLLLILPPARLTHLCQTNQRFTGVTLNFVLQNQVTRPLLSILHEIKRLCHSQVLEPLKTSVSQVFMQWKTVPYIPTYI